MLRISLAGLPLLCLQLPTDEIDAWRCTLTREPTAEAQRATFARYFSGNLVPAGAEPAAHCYCGHQFG